MVAVVKVHTEICVVILPKDARGEEHCSIIYSGEAGAGSVPRGPLVTQVKLVARWATPIVTRVTEHDTFGHAHETVQVARLDPGSLMTLWILLSPYHHSQWGFKPHITEVGGVLRPVGSFVHFDRVALWYGEDHTAYRLGSGEPCS